MRSCGNCGSRRSRGPRRRWSALVYGNKCYVAGYHEIGDRRRTSVRRREIADRQAPFALILGCADSRVAPEVLFGAGLGDLFVVRSRGQLRRPPLFQRDRERRIRRRRIEGAADRGPGTEGCGAVKAAVRVVRENVELPGSIDMIADSIRPVVKDVANSPGDLVANAVEANVRHGVNLLTTSFTMLKRPLDDGRLKVIGATYELKSGLVRNRRVTRKHPRVRTPPGRPIRAPPRGKASRPGRSRPSPSR